MLCTGAPLFLVVLQTDQKTPSLPYSLCAAFLLRHFQYSPCVCIKHQACRTASAGPSTLRQSQPSVEGDRTVRWPPQGREQFLLLMHPRRQDWSALSSSRFFHPTYIPSSLPTFISEKWKKKWKRGGKKESHWFSCTPAPRRLFSFRFPCASTYETFTPSFINTHADMCLRTNIYEWLLRS